jgi:hypothetical protein
MARLAGVAGFLDPGTHKTVELSELGARSEVIDGPPVDREQLIE